MKNIYLRITFLFIVSGSLFSCATICGGSKYNANILVNGRPSAQIVYQGQSIGVGSASIKVKRKFANRFSLTVKERGCQDQTFDYVSRTFRGWALVGTIVTFTTSDYVPYGLGIDLLTGALWKPDATERGVTKHNYKNFQYVLNYTGCDSGLSLVQVKPVESDMLVDVVYLKNGSIIRGTLLESDSVTQVKIQMRDGSIFVFKVDEVLKITRE